MIARWFFAAWSLLLLTSCSAEVCSDCGVEPPPIPTFTPCGPGAIGQGDTCRAIGPRCELPLELRGDARCGNVGASCPADQRITPAGCVPLGFTACPFGFALGERGCAPVRALTPCTGSTKAQLGSTECIELPGCDEPFPPASATLFVDLAGPSDATHFRGIQRAIDAAPIGATIAIAPGVYREVLLVDHPVTLVGRCARDVEVRGPGIALPGLWVRSTRGAVARGLSLVGHDGGVELDGQSTLTLDGMRLEANVGVGLLLLQTSSVSIMNSVIRLGQSRLDGSSGRGIALQAGSQLYASDVQLEANRDIGLYVSGLGTYARARGSIIEGTTPSASGDGGQGIYVKARGRLELDGSSLQGSIGSALVVGDSGTEAELRGVAIDGVERGAGIELVHGATLVADGLAIRDIVGLGLLTVTSSATIDNAIISGTRRPTGSDQAFGIVASEGATLRLTGTALSDNDFIALSVEDVSTRVTMVGATIEGTQGDLAPAINVNGGRLSITEANFDDNGAAAVLFSNPLAATGELTRVTIRGTRANQSEQTGAGIVVNTGTVTITDSELADNYALGLAIGRDDSRAFVTLRHSTIRSSRGRPEVPIDREEGFGVWVAGQGRLDAEDCTFEANEFAGLFVRGDTTLRDSKIVGSLPNTRGDFGNGLYAEGKLRLERTILADNRTIGLQANGPDAVVTMVDSLIEGTLPKADQIFGHGAVASFGGTLLLEGSEVRGSAGAGVVLQEGAIALVRARIIDNAVGIYTALGIILEEVELPTPIPGHIQVSRDSILSGNQTRTSLGPLPLPEPLRGPQ